MASDARRNYVSIAKAYARGAIKDKAGRKHCRWVRLAAKRFLDDMQRAQSNDCAFAFVEWHAVDVCDFIEGLPHIEGRWATPTITLEPWQIFCLCAIFGFRKRSDGTRRVSMVYLEVARKNAKSTLAAGVALYCLTCEGELGPQVLLAATTGEQAGKVFQPAKHMVERTPELRDAFGLSAFARSIPCYENSGYIRPVNAKASTQDGHNPHCVILDELHAHKTRDLFDVMKSAFGARRNPLMFAITTAGYIFEGVCYEQRKFVTQLLDGIVSADHYFGIIYTLDDDDDCLDPRVWIKANPNLNVSVQLANMEDYAKEARLSPASLAEFQTKRCNIWTTAKSGYVNIPAWKRCNGVVDLADLAKVPCWAALDLASTTDMCAIRLVWKDGERVKTWGRYYLPEETITPRTERGNVPYQQWARAGLLVATPGNVTDYDYIERDILALMKQFRIVAWAYDPWNARDICNRLIKQGVPMVEFRQGIPSYTSPMKEAERLYTVGLLDHGGDPILTWNASNVVARYDQNRNCAPDRKNSQEKIDGFCAFVMALGLLINKVNAPPSGDVFIGL